MTNRLSAPGLGAAVSLAVLVGLVSACNGLGLNVRKTHLDHQAFTIGRNAPTSLVVQTFNGNVTVTAIGEGSADISVTSHGTAGNDTDANAALATVKVSITQAGGTISVAATTTGDAPLGASRGADVDVQLPPTAALNITTSNGRVEAVNTTGQMVIQTSNGSVTTRGGQEIAIKTSNGAISLTQPRGSIDVSTSNASVDVLNADQVIAKVGSSNGAVSFSGSLAAGNHTFTTSNAQLSIKLPASQGFRIDASTSNGAITTDFPGLSSGGRTLTGQVGDGSANITATTSNGALSVTKLTP